MHSSWHRKFFWKYLLFCILLANTVWCLAPKWWMHDSQCICMSSSHSGEILGNKQDYKVNLCCHTPEQHVVCILHHYLCFGRPWCVYYASICFCILKCVCLCVCVCTRNSMHDAINNQSNQFCKYDYHIHTLFMASMHHFRTLGFHCKWTCVYYAVDVSSLVASFDNFLCTCKYILVCTKTMYISGYFTLI